ncbi:AmmeMemoRadiSam system protein B, partial [Patescibacteria group bacterium]
SVAGQFYPLEKSELENELEKYLQQAEKINKNSRLRILIAPHAGIKYSGKTAADGFKQLENENYTKVIIIGVNHQKPFSHAAVYSSGNWETPLGTVNVNESIANSLVNNNEILKDFEAHEKEHSLEMILIYLQKVLSDFTIVPISLNNPTEQVLEYLSFKIANLVDDNTLIVISTDLSHYPNWENANIADKRTVDAILSTDISMLENAINSNKSITNLSTSACGYFPLRVGLRVAEILNFTESVSYGYKNSGDITGDHERVVGYSSIGIYSEKIKPITLSQSTKEISLKLARNAINKLILKDIINEEPVKTTNELKYPIGAFITLTKKGELRGCIGQFEPNQPLESVIKEVSVNSATKDPRFSPVTKEELNDIEIEISTMSPQKQISDWRNIELGKHGVKIVNGNNTGTLLPQVAKDGEYTLESFLDTICVQKAGLKKDCYKNPNTIIYTYEVEIFSEANY